MILVTGGSGGIGWAVVQALRGCGLSVDNPTRFELDVSKEASWEAYLDGTTELTGLVNCAGVSSEDSLFSCSEQEWDRVMDTNAKSVFLGMRTCAPWMRGGGAIVNVASIFGDGAGAGRAVAYQASKAAVISLTRNAAVWLAPFNIRVNAVAPGFVKTAMTEGKGYDDYAKRAPMRRMLDPDEVAHVVRFLVSPEASGMTGETVFIDGGWNAR